MKKLLCALVILSLALSLASCGGAAGEQVSPSPAASPPSSDGQSDTDAALTAIAEASTTDELKTLINDFLDSGDYTLVLAAVDKLLELSPSDEYFVLRADIQIRMLSDAYAALNDAVAEDIGRVEDPAAYKESIYQLYTDAGLEVVIPYTPDYASEEEINEVGNISLNLFSGFWKGDDASSDSGVFASQGDWVYYADSTDGFALHKARLDGQENQTVCSDWAAYINVIGDWVYYVNRSDGDLIYRIRTDGTERTKLCGDASTGLCVVGDYVYYINTGAGSEVYRMKTDGSGQEPFSKPASLLFSDGGWLYFLGPDSYALIRVPVEGGDPEVLLDSDTWLHRTQILDGWIYYVTDIYGMILMRMPVEGGQSEEFCRFDGKLSSFALADGYLITSERAPDSSEAIRVYDLGTMSLLHELVGPSSDSICMASDGSVYFGNYGDSDTFYRIDPETAATEKIT